MHQRIIQLHTIIKHKRERGHIMGEKPTSCRNIQFLQSRLSYQSIMKKCEISGTTLTPTHPKLGTDFLSARCSFSYSRRKCSKLLSPTSSWRTSGIVIMQGAIAQQNDEDFKRQTAIFLKESSRHLDRRDDVFMY